MIVKLSNPRFEALEEISSKSAVGVQFYRARDVQSGGVVQLRIAPASLSTTMSDLVPSIKQAVQENALLSSPNIARILDGGIEPSTGELFLVSEAVAGITLRERIRRVAPFSLAVTADIAIGIAEALSDAHQAGVVHGLVTTSSVLLGADNKVRVCDFGLTRPALAVLSRDAGPANAVYVDPANPNELPRAGDDIFALGIILYEMLTGALPAQTDRLISARTINASIPTAYEGIIQKATHPDGQMRYRDVDSMLDDLMEVRDAIKNGRPLTWSPLAARPVRQPRPGKDVKPGALTEAADELEDEREDRGRNSPGALSVALKVMLVIFVIALVAAAYMLSLFLAVPNNITVPQLIGKTVDDARSLSKQQKFQLLIGGSDYSMKWPQNQIYKQDPEVGTEIKEGQPITVFSSLGPRLALVPDLKGMTVDGATQALENAGLPAPTTVQQYSDSVPSGLVISQSVLASSSTARDTTVSLAVSQGPQKPDPPTNVDASPAGSNEVDVTWAGSARASTYKVIRTLDGTSITVAAGITGTEFTDTTVDPDTQYTYTVKASNTAGDSDASAPGVAQTPPPPDAGTPSMPDSVNLAPPDGGTASSSSSTAGASQAQMRQFDIAFRVPRHPEGQHHVQFEVQDATGTTLVYDERHDSGDQIDAPVTAFGNKVIFRIFVDGKLIKQKTL